MEDGLMTWAIYENPRDYPGKFVVRVWGCLNGRAIPRPAPLAVVETIEEARAVLPAGLISMGRSPQDDPVIREVWL